MFPNQTSPFGNQDGDAKKMNKLIAVLLIGSAVVATDYGYNGSTLSVVTLTGAIIKTKNLEDNHKKYKRKDCPVCKGKGWYISGDGIAKVTCGYCEEETTQDSTVIHPPVMIPAKRK
jgi:hypothetical protein